jgi:large subunit ribosomal protein L21
MYAVIRTGGKQYKVNKGDVIEVEHLRMKGDQTTAEITPVLVVTDDGKAISGAQNLTDYKVGVKVLGDTKGGNVTVFKYRSKSGYASKTGHRQLYSLIEITSIGDHGKSGSADAEKGAKTAKKKKATAPAEASEPATLNDDGS